MSTLVVLEQMIVIFLLVIVGFALTKKKIVTREGSRMLSVIVLNVTNPAMILSAVLTEDISVSHGELLLMILVSAIVYAVLIILGWLLPRVFRVPRTERIFYNVMTVYTNTGFIGLPVVSAVMGPSAMIYISVMNIFFGLLFYTHGHMVLLSGTEGGKAFSPMKLINIGTISSAAAILLFWFGVRLPSVAETTLSYMGRATTFLSMIVLGSNLARAELRSLFKNVRVMIFSIVRMLAVPALFIFIAKPILNNDLMVGTIALLIAMPAANTPLMIAEKHGIRSETLTQGILLSTVFSLATITLVGFML